MTMNCPHCGQALNANFAPGQVVQCPNCRNTFAATGPQPGMYAPPPQPMAYAQGGGGGYVPPGGYAKRSNGFAIAALVCGILCLWPLALIFGIVGIIKGKDPRVGGRGMAIAGMVLGIIVPILSLGILLPALNKAREQANRVKCAANLHSIYVAMYLYSTTDRQGRFPATPEKLLLSQDITTDVFICPSTDDKAATGASLEQKAGNLGTGGHNSYVYLGAGKNNSASSQVVLVYEVMDHHHGGFNAAFGDGHVEFIPQPVADQVQAELKAGQNPPPSYRGGF